MKNNIILILVIICLSCNNAKETYIVKKGDTLSEISEDFDIPIKNIKRWNNLENNNIQLGQKLHIYYSNVALENIPFSISKKELRNIVKIPRNAFSTNNKNNLSSITYDIPHEIKINLKQAKLMNGFARFYFLRDSLSIKIFGGKWPIKNKKSKNFNNREDEMSYSMKEYLNYLEGLGFSITRNSTSSWIGKKDKLVALAIREGYPDEPIFLIYKNTPGISKIIDSTYNFKTKEVIDFIMSN